MVQSTFCDLDVLNVKPYSTSVIEIRPLQGKWVKGMREQLQRECLG